MRFWWVNHSQTFDREVGNGYIWWRFASFQCHGQIHRDHLSRLSRDGMVRRHYRSDLFLDWTASFSYFAGVPADFVKPFTADWPNWLALLRIFSLPRLTGTQQGRGFSGEQLVLSI